MERDEGSISSLHAKIITAVAFVAVIGLALLLGLVVLLLANGVPFEYVIFLSLAFLATVCAICFMFLRPISGFAGRPARRTENETDPQIQTYEQPRLEEPKQQPASVVENTTRTLDEVELEPRR